MGYGLLNLGSLLFGLIAWALPVVTLAKRDTTNSKNRIAFPIASVSACALSLFTQILYQDYLVRKEDWSALMDTSNASALASSVLLVITLALNAIAIAKRRG